MCDIFLCKATSIPQNGSKGFSLPKQSHDPDIEKNRNEDIQQAIFIIHRNGQYYGYKNICPHTGASLNWQPNVFMDFDNFYIQCAIHAARFEVESGLCVWGPCVNQSLQKINLRINDNNIYLCT